jgi:hypothetical protein
MYCYRGCKTYEEVADKAKLPEPQRSRYIAYMRARWVGEESTQCEVGYAGDWALRFLGHDEYGASDSIGQSILDNM